jgi:hypothetical protein
MTWGNWRVRMWVMFMDIVEGLGILKGILPENSLEFAMKIILEAGVRSICFKEDRCALAMSLFGVPGMCDIESKKIDLDLGMDKEHLKRVIFHRHGIKIEAEEVPLWIVAHEAGHVVHGESQVKAEEFAKEKFLEWRSLR